MNKLLTLFILFALSSSCKEQEARKPISVKSGSFFEESVIRNKALLAKEETLIQQLIKKDTTTVYLPSQGGFWYSYKIIDSSSTIYPTENDLVTLTYNIQSIHNQDIYSQETIGTVTYKVDKQYLFPGLRAGIKLMRKGETVTFIFPSSLGYGYHGDNNKIGTNIPLKSTVTLIDINKQIDSIIK